MTGDEKSDVHQQEGGEQAIVNGSNERRGSSVVLRGAIFGSTKSGKTSLFRRLQGGGFVTTAAGSTGIQKQPTNMKESLMQAKSAMINWLPADNVKVVNDSTVRLQMLDVNLSVNEPEAGDERLPKGLFQCFILMLDPRQDLSSQEDIVKQVILLSLHEGATIPVCIVLNFRDLIDGQHLLDTFSSKLKKFLAGFNGAQYHISAASMRNCYGLRDLHTFFNIPYINFQKAIIQKKLEEADLILTEKWKVMDEEAITYIEFVNKLNTRKQSANAGDIPVRQRKLSEGSHTVESSATSSEVEENIARNVSKIDIVSCPDNGSKHALDKKMDTAKTVEDRSKFVTRRIMRVQPISMASRAKEAQQKVLTEEEQLDAFLASSDEEDELHDPPKLPLDPNEREDLIEREDDGNSTESNEPRITIETKKEESHHPKSNGLTSGRISSDDNSVEAEDSTLGGMDDGGSSCCAEQSYNSVSPCRGEALHINSDSKLRCAQNIERKETEDADVVVIGITQIQIASDAKCRGVQTTDLEDEGESNADNSCTKAEDLICKSGTACDGEDNVGKKRNLEKDDHESYEFSGSPDVELDSPQACSEDSAPTHADDESEDEEVTSRGKFNANNGQTNIDSANVDHEVKAASIDHCQIGDGNNAKIAQDDGERSQKKDISSDHSENGDSSNPASTIAVNGDELSPKALESTGLSSKATSTLKKPSSMLPGCEKDRDGHEVVATYKSRVQIVNDSDTVDNVTEEKPTHFPESSFEEMSPSPSPGVSLDALRAIKMAQEALEDEMKSGDRRNAATSSIQQASKFEKKKKKKNKQERKSREKKKEKKGKKRLGDESLKVAS
eukprot:CAMPEP_0196805594 /NCGR_PEP_ID=MMETSP1362-20130617/5383_1 /TAXON_ID=163516 /ORGANISM="Leptocylindrus danicus, Strain CCMP1856" /LENGTH=841 /DNA_ID=CAMNT_0042178613 /DNA_START=122 /DNA_END=2647 /DNA_ORIENTATION=-